MHQLCAVLPCCCSQHKNSRSSSCLVSCSGTDGYSLQHGLRGSLEARSAVLDWPTGCMDMYCSHNGSWELGTAEGLPTAEKASTRVSSTFSAPKQPPGGSLYRSCTSREPDSSGDVQRLLRLYECQYHRCDGFLVVRLLLTSHVMIC